LFSEHESKQLQSIERLIGRKFELETIPGFAPSKKAPVDSSDDDDDDEYGNFEADTKPQGRGQSKGRGSRGRH
jgi:ATP-dependent RNA helicase RhlE